MKKPVEVYGFDTEDDSKGNPTLFSFVHGKGSAWYRTREDAIAYLHKVKLDSEAAGTQAELWATNLEYDLVNLFPPEMIAQIQFRWGRSFLVGARWNGIEFRDTMRHVPASVEELGKLVGLKKLKRNFKSSAYAIRDAAITFRAGKHLHSVYDTLGQYPRQTLAGTALAIWKSRYFKTKYFRPLPEVWDAASKAYYGGRTEPFSIGSYGPVTVIDVASMFPWAMLGQFPVPWGSFRRTVRDRTTEPIPDANGIYRVRVRSDVELPILPVRTEQGLIYPNGQFEGWYVGSELNYARRCGVTMEVLEGFEFFDTCRPFDKYVADLFKRKSLARGPMRTVYKLLLNALYGKFGQKGEKVISVPLDKFKTMRRAPEDFRVWNGLAIYRKDMAAPPHSNMIWPAIITARARVRLHEEMSDILGRGGRLFYCDTDSIMFQGKGRYPSKATEPGQFESRGTFQSIMIVGKKEYAIRDFKGKMELHAKGVPYGEKGATRLKYLETGEVKFMRPIRLLESARDGTKANLWREVPKKRHVDFSSRARKADGSLIPLTISADRGRLWRGQQQRKRTHSGSRPRTGVIKSRAEKSRNGKPGRKSRGASFKSSRSRRKTPPRSLSSIRTMGSVSSGARRSSTLALSGFKRTRKS